MKRNKQYKNRRISIFLLIAVLVCSFPLQARAEEEAAVREVHHIHIGNEREGNGCYKEEVKHKHEGNAGKEGGCYRIPIYHIHTGSSTEGGGCFGEIIYHAHTGVSSQEGGCYTVPQKHTHTGSPSEGGGCYVIPACHTHKGSVEGGGACYTPIYHQHAENCYEIATCIVEYESDLQVVRNDIHYCYHHGNGTKYSHITANYRHMSCGQGIVWEEGHVCWQCMYFTKKHEYKRKICTKDAEIEGYRFSCMKTDQTVDSWRAGCGKTEDSVDFYKVGCGKREDSIEAYKRICEKNEMSVDAYAVGCGKTEETIDRYAKNCGREEDIPYARVTIANSNAQWTSGNKILKVSCEEVNGAGFLKWQEPAFLWEKNGVQIAERNGAEVKINENGVYTVRIQVENEDIVPEERAVSIQIKKIDTTPPIIERASYDDKAHIMYVKAKDLQPDGSKGSGLDKQPYSFDGGLTWSEEDSLVIERGLSKEELNLKVFARDVCGNVAEKEITTEETEPEGKTEDGSQEGPETGEGDEENKEDKENKENKEDKEDKESSGLKPEIKGVEAKKKEEAEPKEKKKTVNYKTKAKTLKPEPKEKKMTAAGETIRYKKKEKKEVPKVLAAEPKLETVPVQTLSGEKGKHPVIKAAAFTMGSVVSIAGMIWMVYLLFSTIRIYHCDGEGKCYYAGSGIMKKRRGNYEVTIPRMILEQSCTGRYSLKPGRLFTERNRGKELIVTAGGQKISVWVDEEIPLRLMACV